MNKSFPLLVLPGIVFTACAGQPSRAPRVMSEPGAAMVPACSSARPDRPREAVEKQLFGSVLVGYTIDLEGQVSDIALEDPKASPILFQAVRDWLANCRAEAKNAQTRRLIELFTFPPWDTPAPSEPVVVWEGSLGLSAPKRDPRCQPDRPPPALLVHGKMTVEYDVHSNGQVGEVSLVSSEVPASLLRTVRPWLRSCPFEPARQSGKPLAVRVKETLVFER